MKILIDAYRDNDWLTQVQYNNDHPHTQNDDQCRQVRLRPSHRYRANERVGQVEKCQAQDEEEGGADRASPYGPDVVEVIKTALVKWNN